MALDKHALSELLDALRAGGDIDLIRSGMQLVMQALIELEAAQQSGGPLPAQPDRSTHRTAPASGCCPPWPATSSCGIAKLRPGSSTPRC